MEIPILFGLSKAIRFVGPLTTNQFPFLFAAPLRCSKTPNSLCCSVTPPAAPPEAPGDLDASS